jgi:hypothetical protein
MHDIGLDFYSFRLPLFVNIYKLTKLWLACDVCGPEGPTLPPRRYVTRDVHHRCLPDPRPFSCLAHCPHASSPHLDPQFATCTAPS